MWSSNGLYVDASVGADGSLHISGQDLRSFDDEYEYELTVAPDDVPRVIAGLGGGPGGDVVELLVGHAEDIVNVGELTWLRSLGIEPDFWSRLG
ncbi:MAG: hypothetical protein DLM58_17225 [Pseudonocardiales bacterium]|nr:MAG: hypothetical protein DLM58_17225 [Pseudonocardiales bacterium]